MFLLKEINYLKKIMHAVIGASITVCFFSCSVWKTFNYSTVEDGVIHRAIGESGHIMFDGFLFDTGAELSCLFKEVPFNMKLVGYEKVSGMNKESNWEKVYYLKSFSIDTIGVNRVFLMKLDTSKVSNSIREIFEKGIIGMNIISKANWLIDFKNETVECVSRDFAHSLSSCNYILLKYRKTLRPVVSINIEGVEIKNVLFDTGSFANMKLSSTDIDRILSKRMADNVGISKYEGLYSEDTIVERKKYLFHQLKINNLSLDSVSIIEDNREPLIGINFLRKFDYLYIDAKNKTFYLYN